MKPRSVEDCAVVTSLVRPGPLEFVDERTGRNMAQEYVERRHGRSKGEIPILDELLPETYGVMCIAKGSKVKTLDGQVNIENVEEGSLVQVETGEYKRVLKNIYQGKKETIKIRLDNSEELILTCDHKVLTQKGWVEAGDLTKNDLIKHFWVSDKNVEEGSDVDWVIGMLLADGQLNQTTYNIAAGTQENALKIKEIVDKTFNINCQIYHHTRCWYVRTTNKDYNNKAPNEDRKNPLREYCKSIGLDGLNCYNKTFPKKIIKKMIEGFIEGDGCVKNKRIRICNETMARQIFETLQAMRIKSNLFNDNEVWTVGFNQKTLSYKNKEKQREVEKDIYIPKEKWKLNRSDDRRQHFTPKKMEGKPFIQRSLAKSIANDYGFVVSDQTWSKVLKIEKDTVRDVYDLSVEDIHSFVVGGNVVHNCFQEQITKITKELAGWDDEKAEDVRIAVGKKKLRMIEELKPQFIKSSSDVGKVNAKTAETIWAMIEKFGRYGFNKSHAVAYSMVAYACAYLKYHYPLEWWAAVLSNAEEKEITEVLWPHVKNILSPPDINLSKEEMVIDYNSGTIRNKLSVLRGLGEKAANKITENRPYANINELVEKEVLGTALAEKLTHIGVLDSLFDSKMNLMEKMQAYKDAVEVWKYKKKIFEKSEGEIVLNQPLEKFIEVAKKHPKTRRCKHEIRKGVIDMKYAFMNPMKDYILKKSIFPTMPMVLHDIIKENSNNVKIIDTGTSVYAMSECGKETRMINGKTYQKIKELPVEQDSRQVITFCVAGYVVESKEFSYGPNREKKALKMNVDVDGHLEEFVIWPDYDTGILEYPENLKKNSVIFLFMHRKMGRERYHTNIDSVIVEEVLA
jgi:DNA polymerase-3 subunit alpha